MSTRALVKLGALSLATAFLLHWGIVSLPADDTKTAEKEAQPAAEATAPKIQLAILLDTSNSMDGLINQARTQIWKIVNTLATAKQDGKSPDLQVALYEYGKSSLPKEQHFVRKILGFTDDLDKVSEELFALKTNGGEEYCGAVIEAATRELDWTKSESDLKLIYVCGNEPFTQGPIDYKASCAASVKRGITVNTIFCGSESEGVRTGWKDGAQLADGSFLSIDQNRVVAEVKTPFDEKLANLSGAVNKTYVAFGRADKQREFLARQENQDRAAATAAPAAAAERAAFKGSAKYANATSDLVDAVKRGNVKLSEIKDQELPEEVKKLKPEARQSYIDGKQAERKKIQDEIKELTEQRNKFIAEEQKKNAKANESDTLDAALIKSIREQAAKRKYKFE